MVHYGMDGCPDPPLPLLSLWSHGCAPAGELEVLPCMQILRSSRIREQWSGGAFSFHGRTLRHRSMHFLHCGSLGAHWYQCSSLVQAAGVPEHHRMGGNCCHCHPRHLDCQKGCTWFLQCSCHSSQTMTPKQLLIAHCAVCLLVVLSLLFGASILTFFSSFFS